MAVSHVKTVTFTKERFETGGGDHITKTPDDLLNEYLRVRREPRVIAVQFIANLFETPDDVIKNNVAATQYLLTFGK